jgi:hypothetical protein
MKNQIKSGLMVVAIFSLVVGTGCKAPAFNTLLSDTQANQTALFATASAAQGNAQPSGSQFIISSVILGSLSAGSTHAEENYVILNFEAGLVDTASLASGLIAYSLKNAADSNTAYPRGTPIPYTAQVTARPTGSKLVLTLDLSGADVSSLIEVKIDGTALTADGGGRKFNGDADAVGGEASEDDKIIYSTVTGAPVTITTGAARKPGWLMNNLPLFDPTAGTTVYTTNYVNSAGGTTNLTASSLTGSLVYEKFSASGWTPVALTTTYSATGGGTLTFTLSEAPRYLDLYRARYDYYLICESDKVADYLHRRWYDQYSPSARYGHSMFDPVGGSFASLTSVTPLGTPTNRCVDIRFDGIGSGIKASTITQSSIRLYDVTNARFVDWVSTEKTYSYVVRVMLPGSFLGPVGDHFVIMVSPQLIDEGATTAATDDIRYGASSNVNAIITSPDTTWP